MRARRLARRALKILLLGTVGLVVVLLLIVQFALALQPVREIVRKQAVGLGSAALKAGLEIDHIDAISVLGHVQARGVRLRNAQGVQVAAVQRVAARFDPLALIFGRVRFASLRLEQPWVDLGAPAEPGDRRGLLGVFVEEQPAPEQAESGSATVVVLDGVDIERGTLLAEYEGERWSAAGLDLEGEIELEIADEVGLDVALENLYAELARGGVPAATLKRVHGEYGAGGAGQLHAEIVQDGARVLADAELGEAGQNGARALAAHLRAQGIDARTLAGFGVRFDDLTAPLGLELHARGTTHALAGDLQLRTAGGTLDIHGEYDEQRGGSARVHTERLEPARFLRAAIAPIALQLSVSAKPDPELPAAAVTAVIESGSYDAMALPRTTLRARVHPDRGVWVDELVAQYENGRLTARGRLGKAGDLWAKAELRSAALSELPPVRAYAKTAAGVLDATFEAERGPSGPVAIRAAVELRQAAFETVQAQALEIEGQVIASSVDDARVKLQVAASSLVVGDQDLGYGEAELHGGPDTYQARVSLGERGRLIAKIARTGPDAIATRGEGRFALGEHRYVQARWDEIGYAAGEVRLRAVQVDYCGARARLDGTFDPDGRSDLHASVESRNLAAATRSLLDRPIAGALALDATLEGETERPRVSVKARYRDGALLGLDDLAIDLDAKADLRSRELAVQTKARAGGGSIALELRSRLARGKPSLAMIERSQYEVALELEDVPLHDLESWPTEKVVPERARVSGELHVKGELERFAAAFDLRSRLRFRGDRTPVFARARGKYSERELSLQLDARDPKGPLVRSSIRTELERRRFGTLPERPLDLLEKHPWQASLSLGSRRVQELPAVRALGVHPALLPAQVAAELDIEHQPARQPEAQLRVSAVWDPPGEHSDESRCGLSRPMKIVLNAEMKEGELKTLVRGDLADQQVLEIKTASQAPIDEWFAPGPPSQVRPVSMTAKVAGLQLRDVPVVCEDAFGFVSAEIDVARAGSEQVKARVDVNARDVHIGSAPAFHGKLTATGDRDTLAVWADIRGNYTGHAVVRGRVPIDRGGHAPTIDLDSPSSLQVGLEQLDARTLLAAVPNVRATRGKLSGRIVLDSPLRTPQVKGRLAVRDAAVTLPTLGQRFDRINGDLQLAGNTIHIEGLELRDREGKAKLTGRFMLNDLTTFETELRADARNFPVRRSGVMLARIDGKLGLVARVQPERTEVDVSLRDARIELTGQSLAGVQSLQDNPQIVLVDEFGQKIEQEGKDEEQDAEAITIIRIDADEPFWIRRTDFSVLVRAKLRMEMQGELPSVSGEVEIERGVVELLGQMFDIERGRIEFVGGHEAKPRLDLVAVRRVPGGATVQVQAQGAVDEPQLTFLVDGEPVTAGEALQASTGTGMSKGGDASAQQQIGSFATGLATGVLTLGARNEIGEWMPVLAVESEAGAARLRAGVEAGRLIPGFLRKVVVDAYLEGSLSSAPEAEDAQSTSTTNDAPQAAVLLELRHPKDLVTEAQYGPGQQWSLDFLWEP